VGFCILPWWFMLSNSLEKIKQNKWLSITIQSSLLGMNVLLVSQGRVNSFILLSIAFIFSLFTLQFVGYRFLIFNPLNLHVKRPVFHFDTFLLFAFTFLAGVLFFMGLSTTHNIEPLVCIDNVLKNYVLWMFTMLVIVLPLYFKFIGRKQISKSIAKRLRSKTYKYEGTCNECGAPGTTYENIVLEWNDLRIRKKCEKCDNDEPKEIKTNLKIG
jgi:hypothetical protein